uniref:dTMP kinase n=1 Tax=Canis lupus familiaris TaxID=9615 RepID=A0A8I3S409_CANLF
MPANPGKAGDGQPIPACEAEGVTPGARHSRFRPSPRAPCRPRFSQSERAPRTPANRSSGRRGVAGSRGHGGRGRTGARMAGGRGALIVLEGVDRAGKSTQSRRLVAALCAAGHRAELLRFPERSTEIGQLLSSYLEKKSDVEDHSVHLLFSANRWEQVSRDTCDVPIHQFAAFRRAQPAACTGLCSALRTRGDGRPAARHPSGRTRLCTCSVYLCHRFSLCELRPLIKKKLSQGITLIVDRYAFSGVAFTSAKEDFSLDWCKQPDVGLPKPDLVVFLQLRLAEAATRGEFGRERYEDGKFQERALRRFHQLMADQTVNWKMVDASKSIEAVHKEIHALSVDTMQAAAQRPLGELWK